MSWCTWLLHGRLHQSRYYNKILETGKLKKQVLVSCGLAQRNGDGVSRSSACCGPAGACSMPSLTCAGHQAAHGAPAFYIVPTSALLILLPVCVCVHNAPLSEHQEKVLCKFDIILLSSVKPPLKMIFAVTLFLSQSTF